MIRAVAMVLCLAAAPAAARDCPLPPDHTSVMAGLLDQLARAPDPLTAQRLMDRLWTLWLIAPDAEAQLLLDRAMALREAGQGEGAMEALDQLVAECPDYAEGWNQRAYLHFLQGNHMTALADLDVALRLLPDHVGALSGRALALFHLGREAEARRALDDALARNPWLPERGLIEAPGTDI
ncbi:MAG: tetratricopeptide repeat protein [Limimaricola soesokkakensis]|uniref:tetratricopeptide repeat protein n=1 Tax=Limimaricola soesokkakensis TaxID=1343159 RepID=UPI0040594D18